MPLNDKQKYRIRSTLDALLGLDGIDPDKPSQHDDALDGLTPNRLARTVDALNLALQGPNLTTEEINNFENYHADPEGDYLDIYLDQVHKIFQDTFPQNCSTGDTGLRDTFFALNQDFEQQFPGITENDNNFAQYALNEQELISRDRISHVQADIQSKPIYLINESGMDSEGYVVAQIRIDDPKNSAYGHFDRQYRRERPGILGLTALDDTPSAPEITREETIAYVYEYINAQRKRYYAALIKTIEQTQNDIPELEDTLASPEIQILQKPPVEVESLVPNPFIYSSDDEEEDQSRMKLLGPHPPNSHIAHNRAANSNRFVRFAKGAGRFVFGLFSGAVAGIVAGLKRPGKGGLWYAGLPNILCALIGIIYGAVRGAYLCARYGRLSYHQQVAIFSTRTINFNYCPTIGIGYNGFILYRPAISDTLINNRSELHKKHGVFTPHYCRLKEQQPLGGGAPPANSPGHVSHRPVRRV